MTWEATANDICSRIACLLPIDSFRDPHYTFLHRALVCVILLAPICSTIGVQVINFRLAFFSEAIGHSSYTGFALGLLLASLGLLAQFDPFWVMIVFGVAVGMVITYWRRQSELSSDTVIGVFSSSVIALGLCVIDVLATNGSGVVKRDTFRSFLMGSIIDTTPADVVTLFGFFVVVFAFQFFAFNRLLFIGINAPLAQTMGISVRRYEYLFAGMLSAVVMFSIRAVGVLVVTALLTIPAAASRNLARSAAGLFWYAFLVSLTSGVAGLVISDRFNTPTGATSVLFTSAWFVFSLVYRRFLFDKRRATKGV